MKIVSNRIAAKDDFIIGGPDHAKSFMADYFNWKELTERTEEAYTSILNLFFEHFALKKSPILYTDVVDYRNFIKSNGGSKIYHRQQIVVIKNYFKYLNTFDHYKNNIDDAIHVSGAKYKGKGRPALTDDQIKAVLKIAQGPYGKRKVIDYRNYAIFRLLAGTGLRIDELTTLKVKDFKRVREVDRMGKPVEICVLSYTQKGGIKSVARVFKKTESAIKLYLSMRGSNNEEDPLFSTHYTKGLKVGESRQILGNNKPIRRSTLLNLVRTVFNEAGLGSEYTSHNFRNTIAKKVFEKMGNENMASQQLRHTSPKSIQFYTKNWRSMISAINSVDVEV